jgi:transitional endoplasmic reticulum ATPase
MSSIRIRTLLGDSLVASAAGFLFVGALGAWLWALGGHVFFDAAPSIKPFWLVSLLASFLLLVNLVAGVDVGISSRLSALFGVVSAPYPFMMSDSMLKTALAWAVLGCYFLISVLAHLASKKDGTRALAASNGEAPAEDDPYGDTFKARKARFGFERVTGMADLKAKLRKIGQEVKSSNARKGDNEARNGILMFSKPGNGKTMIAEALAGELQLPMIELRFGDVASRWVNQTTEGVKAAFTAAVRQAPCILFIDEVDSFIESRDGGQGGETVRTTNAILTALVDIRKHGVIVIAATNYLDRLDTAATREGRFDYKIEIPDPDFEARKGILSASLAKRSVAVDPDALERACRRWTGFSAARLNTIGIEVADVLKKEGATVATFDTLMAALRSVQGHKGRLAEDTPELSQIALAEPGRSRLAGIAGRLKNIEKIERMGGTLPNGILFYGPPGTGKTLTARALAKTSDCAFLATSGADLLADPKRIDSLLADAANLRPCIVFIDEADDILADRGGFGGNTAITNKLLAAMQGADGQVPDIIFIAATNHPDNMDSAALRGGRFTEKVAFALPDQETMTTFVSEWMKKTKATLGADFKANAVAEILAGQSMANVVEILKAAVNRMVERELAGEGNEPVCLADVRAALRIVVY